MSISQTIVIKRYNRSRLYDCVNGRYVSIEILRAWETQKLAFTVLDAETGEDVTRVLLA